MRQNEDRNRASGVPQGETPKAPSQLSEVAAQELQAIWSQAFNQALSQDEAAMIGARLLDFFDRLFEGGDAAVR